MKRRAVATRNGGTTKDGGAPSCSFLVGPLVSLSRLSQRDRGIEEKTDITIRSESERTWMTMDTEDTITRLCMYHMHVDRVCRVLYRGDSMDDRESAVGSGPRRVPRQPAGNGKPPGPGALGKERTGRAKERDRCLGLRRSVRGNRLRSPRPDLFTVLPSCYSND